MIENKTNNR